ncbi:MAG TPA: glyceraldehyde 3-phosphate dehydrogenase NAD-binding domain-containing protein [Pseudomonadales bacterium]
MDKIRIGMMGFGRVGRQIYRLAQLDDRFDIVAVSDIGQPQILHHLLTKGMSRMVDVRLEGSHLVSPKGRTRMLSADRPMEVPWDVFDVDVVIDVTGKFRSSPDLAPHLDSGAPRVISSVLPDNGSIDRVVIVGVNEEQASPDDRIVSAGSASTAAAALALKTITDAYPIEHASITSVHEFTSDQVLEDYAGPDYRRSRSGARNIIPNTTPALTWVPKVLPAVADKISGYAMNVPVQTGSMLDLTVRFEDTGVEVDAVNALFEAAAKAKPNIIAVTWDPIVSSDVRGEPHSLLVDLEATLKSGSRLMKVIGWHESLGHAARILDLVALYARLDGARSKRKEAS